MRRQFLAALAFAAALSQAATTDTTWQYTPYSNEVTDLKVFHPGANPTVWIGTNHGVVRIQGTDTLWLHPTNSKLPNEYISGSALPNVNMVTTVTALDSVGNYWIGYRNKNKLVRITPSGTVTVFDSSASTPWNTINGITASATTVYVGNSNGGIFAPDQYTKESPIWNPLLSSLEANSGITLTALASGWNDTLLWIGYSGNANGNLKYLTKNGTIGYFTDGNTKITAPVYSIWCDSADGAKFIRTTTEQTYGYLKDDTLLVISSSNQSGMVSMLDSGHTGQFTAVPNASGYPSFLKNGKLWLISNNRGFLDATPSKTVDTEATVGAFLGGSTTLFGTLTRLYGYQPVGSMMSLVERRYGPSLAGNGIVSATHGAGGALWIATDSVLYYRDDMTPMKSVYTSSPAKLRTIGRDSSGILWIGQSNGLFSLKNNSATLSSTKDTVVAMAFATNYDWFLTKTSAGKFILAQFYQNSKWSTLPMTGIDTDSTRITKLRATDDGQLYALANGIVYWYSGLSWSKAYCDTFVNGTGPGSGDFSDIDLAGQNLWSEFQAPGQCQKNAWGVASTSATIASGAFSSLYEGGFSAESDSSAWFFNEPSPAMFTGVLGDAALYRVSANTKSIVESYTSNSVLHTGKAANGEHIFSDNNGGLWIVMNDGVLRMKVTTSTPSGISSHASSLASPLASLRAGKLELSLASAAAVRIQVLDLNGRVLERQDLGTLAAGSHAVNLSKGQGLRLVRVQAGEQCQTLRLPSL